MPNPTKAELAGQLAEELRQLRTEFVAFRQVTETRLRVHEDLLAKRLQGEEQLRTAVHEQAVKNAVVDEKCRGFEKHLDRRWQVWLALIGAGLAVVVAFVKK